MIYASFHFEANLLNLQEKWGTGNYRTAPAGGLGVSGKAQITFLPPPPPLPRLLPSA
jgi:hypothetical protein